MKNGTLTNILRGCFDLRDVGMRLGMSGYADGSDILCELANRIDNEYIMLPKYEDGKPVHLLDPCAPTDKYGTNKITRLCFTPKGFYFNSSHAAKGLNKVHKFKYGDAVPRPSVEIRPSGDGDVVEARDMSEKVFVENKVETAPVLRIGSEEVHLGDTVIDRDLPYRGIARVEGVDEAYSTTFVRIRYADDTCVRIRPEALVGIDPELCESIYFDMPNSGRSCYEERGLVDKDGVPWTIQDVGLTHEGNAPLTFKVLGYIAVESKYGSRIDKCFVRVPGYLGRVVSTDDMRRFDKVFLPQDTANLRIGEIAYDMQTGSRLRVARFDFDLDEHLVVVLFDGDTKVLRHPSQLTTIPIVKSGDGRTLHKRDIVWKNCIKLKVVDLFEDDLVLGEIIDTIGDNPNIEKGDKIYVCGSRLSFDCKIVDFDDTILDIGDKVMDMNDPAKGLGTVEAVGVCPDGSCLVKVEFEQAWSPRCEFEEIDSRRLRKDRSLTDSSF